MKEKNAPFDTFRATLGDGLKHVELELEAAAVARLYAYFVELKKWSARVNLIARGSSDNQIIEAHFLDSLTMLPMLPEQNGHLLDIGTGAGFPGLVVKAALPELKVTLVEPRLKRVTFLKHIVRTLKLNDVDVLACRAEDHTMLPADRGFTHVTSRAVTDIGGFLALGARFALPGVRVICMKGPKWQEELDQAQGVISDFGFSLQHSLTTTLPMSGAERTLLAFCRDQR